MKLQFTIITVLLFTSFCLSDPIFIVEVAREGLTTPKVPLICKKSNIEHTEYNDALSEYGRQQQYLLGLEMRARYGKSILEDKCDPLHIFAYSVSKESTMLSGQVQLFGICPLGYNQDISPDMVDKAFPPFDFPDKNKIAAELGLHATPYNFMPLPLHSTYNDPIFGAEDSAQYPIPVSTLPDSPEERQIDSMFSGTLYPYLAQLSGLDRSEMKASTVIDTVNELLWLIQIKKLKRVPKMVRNAAKDFVYQYYTHYWGKADREKYASMFFKEFTIKLKNAVLAQLNPLLDTKIPLTATMEKPDYAPEKIRYFLYEVGDLQMYTYAITLGIEQVGYIPPSSVFIFEVSKTCELRKAMTPESAMNCFKISIKLNDKEVDTPLCQSPCNLKEFYTKLTEKYVEGNSAALHDK